MISKNQNINLIRKYLEEVKSNLQNEYNKALENASGDPNKYNNVSEYVNSIEVVYLE